MLDELNRIPSEQIDRLKNGLESLREMLQARNGAIRTKEELNDKLRAQLADEQARAETLQIELAAKSAIVAEATSRSNGFAQSRRCSTCGEDYADYSVSSFMTCHRCRRKTSELAAGVDAGEWHMKDETPTTGAVVEIETAALNILVLARFNGMVFWLQGYNLTWKINEIVRWRYAPAPVAVAVAPEPVKPEPIPSGAWYDKSTGLFRLVGKVIEANDFQRTWMARRAEFPTQPVEPANPDTFAPLRDLIARGQVSPTIKPLMDRIEAIESKLVLTVEMDSALRDCEDYLDGKATDPVRAIVSVRRALGKTGAAGD